jgi:hypothetical protein
MSFTTYAALEQMMQQRVADRLHEAEQNRLADAAQLGRGANGSSSRISAALLTSGLVRFLVSLF